MATFSPYNAGAYERQKRDVEYDYSTNAANNAYSRFLSQQRGQRSLGDMSRSFGRQFPIYKASFGQRGLSGGAVNSGTMRQSMANYVGDYARDFGRQQQDLTQQLQQHDLELDRLGAFRQQSLADIEAEKAQAIANDAAAIEYLRSLVGGL